MKKEDSTARNIPQLDAAIGDLSNDAENQERPISDRDYSLVDFTSTIRPSTGEEVLTSDDPDLVSDPSMIRQIAATSFHAANSMRNGFYAAYTSVGIPTFLSDPQRPFDLSIHERSIFASSGTLAFVIACALSGTFARIVGKHFESNKVLIVLLVPTWLAWFLIAFPVNWSMMVTARVIQGVLGGFAMPMAQLYTTEVVHKSFRGLLLSSSMIVYSFALLLGYILGSFVKWRTLAVTFAGVNFLFLPLLIILPPSPVQLLKRGKDDEALVALVSLRGSKYDSKAELMDMKMHLKETKERVPSCREMLRMSYLKPLFIAAALIMLRPLTGYFQVIFFTLDIFEAAYSAMNPNHATIIVGSLVFIFTVVSGLLVDRIGRKRLAVLATFVMAIANGTLATYFIFQDSAKGTRWAWLPLLLIITIVTANCLGIIHLQNLVLGELIPLQIKTQATGILYALGALSLFVSLLTFEYKMTGIGNSGTFWVITGACGAMCFVCFFFLPETKGRSLREIETDITQAEQLRQLQLQQSQQDQRTEEETNEDNN